VRLPCAQSLGLVWNCSPVAHTGSSSTPIHVLNVWYQSPTSSTSNSSACGQHGRPQWRKKRRARCERFSSTVRCWVGVDSTHPSGYKLTSTCSKRPQTPLNRSPASSLISGASESISGEQLDLQARNCALMVANQTLAAANQVDMSRESREPNSNSCKTSS
jgi:hypothetical protein